MKKTISNKTIFKVWLPLLASWLMMSIEGPLIAAFIARMAEPKINLAAYGIAFAFALIIEAPVIMMLSAATALVQNPQSFYKLRRFTYLLNAVITGLMVLLILPPVFDFILSDTMNLPLDVVKLTHIALLLMIIWPGAIGYRRFYQGIMIRFGFARRVAYGTIVRLFAMAGSTGLLFLLDIMPGAYMGALALSAGVLAEALVSRWMARDALQQLFNCEKKEDESVSINYKQIITFYYPLALTTVLALAIQPALTFFMAYGRYALESLAVWPVVNSFVFIFRSFGLSYQEVAISLLDREELHYSKIMRFAFFMAIFVSGTLALIALTPLIKLWLHDISGLNDSLAVFAYFPVQVLIIMPAFSVWLSFQRAVLINRRNTSPVTLATIIEVSVVILTMLIFIFYSSISGVTIAAFALILGRFGSNSFLWLRMR